MCVTRVICYTRSRYRDERKPSESRVLPHPSRVIFNYLHLPAEAGLRDRKEHPGVADLPSPGATHQLGDLGTAVRLRSVGPKVCITLGILLKKNNKALPVKTLQLAIQQINCPGPQKGGCQRAG
jgi:hypothetical protein